MVLDVVFECETYRVSCPSNSTVEDVIRLFSNKSFYLKSTRQNRFYNIYNSVSVFTNREQVVLC